MGDTGLFLAGAAFLLLILCLLPLIYQAWKSAKRMVSVLEEVNKNLPQILQNLEKITSDISASTEVLKREADELVLFSSKMRRILDITTTFENIITSGLRQPLKTTRAVLRGLKAFLDVFLKRER